MPWVPIKGCDMLWWEGPMPDDMRAELDARANSRIRAVSGRLGARPRPEEPLALPPEGPPPRSSPRVPRRPRSRGREDTA